MVKTSISVLSNSEKLCSRFAAENRSKSFKPSWNIQGGQLIPVVRRQSSQYQLTLDMLEWGVDLNKNGSCAKRLCLTALEYKQPIYDYSFYRRCLVAANWLQSCSGNEKVDSTEDFSFARQYSESVALAAIWDIRRDLNNEISESFFLLNAQDRNNEKIFDPILVRAPYWRAWIGDNLYCDLSPVISPYTVRRRYHDLYVPRICYQVP